MFNNKHGSANMKTTTQRNTAVDIQPAFMRRPEAARYLGVSQRTVSDWQSRRIIPCVKAGVKCVLFKRADLDAAMQRFTVNAVGC